VAPPKHKTGGGRTTAKGTRPNEGQKFDNPNANTSGVGSSSRYTPPVPAEMKLPKPWVPWLMIALLVAGMVIIILRNLVFTGNNWLTLAGLACILGGLYTATKWR
jgi:LPXTG-motif cell wall-anchored protein